MHYETFEQTPPDVAAKMIHMGQRLARKFKSIYRVERVAFLFTGGDVAHVHAHVIPMHEKTDITSARYITNLDIVSFGSDHLMTDRLALESVRSKLGDI
jgi:histidine triad (HIT) family protein